MTAMLPAIPAILLCCLAACKSPGNRAVVGEEIRYQAGGTECVGFLAYDSGLQGRRPGVLIVHEWWGHNDYVRERARMLAALGYTALALDMYGDGRQAEHPDDAQRYMTAVFADMAAGVERFQAARRVLAEHPATDPRRIAAIGYCFGGAIVLHMARAGEDLDAVASFHGGLATATPARPGAVRARVLVCHGGDDALIPGEQVAAFRQEMAAAGVALSFVTYPGAKHGFTNPSATALGERFGLPLAYDEEADRRSWSELQRLLRAVWP